MKKQLAKILVLHRRLPNGWKPVLHQKTQHEPGIAHIRLLLPRAAGPDRTGISQQKLMSQLVHQLSKPAQSPRCFHTDAHLLTCQGPVKLLCFGGMVQPPLPILARLQLHIRDLLETRMKITTYNHHARLLSPELLGRLPATSLLRLREPTLSCNQRYASHTPPKVKWPVEHRMIASGTIRIEARRAAR